MPKNLDVLREDKGEFIVGMKLGVFRDKHGVYYDDSKLTGLNDSVCYVPYQFPGQDLVIYWDHDPVDSILPGIGDAAFMTSKGAYIQKGDVTLEISTLVMNGYLPGHIGGEPLKALAQRVAAAQAS
jgi:hypothetical protein